MAKGPGLYTDIGKKARGTLSLSLSLYLLLNSELGFGGVGGFFSDHTKLMLFDESCNWSLFVFCRSVVQGLPQ